MIHTIFGNIRKIGLMLGILGIISSCVEEIPMIDPPKPKGDNEDAFIGYFVKEDGTGSGLSWDDAMSPARFRSMFAQGFRNGDEIFMAGGTYYVGEADTEYLEVSKGIVVKGGFDPASTGYNTDITYPSQFETIISGDINQNGKADTGDCHLMEVSAQIPAAFYGITFKHGYLETCTHNERPGIYIKDGGNLELNYCKIVDCVSAITATNATAGGAAMVLYYGTANLYKTIISGNKSNNRGGAIRLQNVSGKTNKLYLDACLITNNGIEKDFGGAIQVSGSPCEIYMNNTTITGNYVGGKGGAAINGGDLLVMINSTVVNNYCANGANGHDIRCESAGKFYIMNSIIVGETGKTDASNPNIIVEGSGKMLNSCGYNLIGTTKVSGGGAFTAHLTDKTGLVYSDIFGTNTLADNDGYPQSIALQNRSLALIPIAIVNQFINERKLPFDVWVDQRGKDRNTTAFCPGAFEY